MAAPTGLKQVVGSVLLAVMAQPLHEVGHAVALRASTGMRPRIGALSVQPLVAVNTNAAALLVLASGDLAVLAWWAVVFLWMRRDRQRNWAIIETSFVLIVVFLQWLTAAVLYPFGRASLGGSDAAKFVELIGLETMDCDSLVTAALVAVFVAIGILVRRLPMAVYPKETLQ